MSSRGKITFVLPAGPNKIILKITEEEGKMSVYYSKKKRIIIVF